MDAIVLAGGRGTRLGCTEANPKPLVAVAGRPILAWIVLHARAQGVRRFVLAVGYGAAAIRAYCGDGAQWDVEIVYDDCQLGTGHAVHRALRKVGGRNVLLLYGDTYVEYTLVTPQEQVVVYTAPAAGNTVARSNGYNRIAAYKGRIRYGFYRAVPAGALIFPTQYQYLLDSAGAPEHVEGMLSGAQGYLLPCSNDRFWDIGTPDSLAQARAELADLPQRYEAVR